MKIIESEFIEHVQKDEQDSRKSNWESENINGWVKFITPEISNSVFQILV